MSEIYNHVYSSNGCHVELKLMKDELNKIRNIITNEYLYRIKTMYGDEYQKFIEYPIDMYHKISKHVDHNKLWPKKNRCLKKENVEIVKNFVFFKKLQEAFGNFTVTDEDNIGREEIYWRLVRPNYEKDVGPIHADSWFWELNSPNETNAKRVKIWMSIYCDDNDTGFKYVPNSHKKKWNYSHVQIDGKMKPIPKLEGQNIKPIKFIGNPGNIIVFNDNLLHGGYVTNSKTRVSLEFTIKIK